MRNSRRSSPGQAVAGVTGVLLVLAAIVAWPVLWQLSAAEHTCTVESKDRATKITVKDGNGQSSSDMRVYTDCGVFSVADDFLRFNFTSADTYAALHEGETVTFTAVGWRAGFFSIFPNIVNVEQQ